MHTAGTTPQSGGGCKDLNGGMGYCTVPAEPLPPPPPTKFSMELSHGKYVNLCLTPVGGHIRCMQLNSSKTLVSEKVVARAKVALGVLGRGITSAISVFSFKIPVMTTASNNLCK